MNHGFELTDAINGEFIGAFETDLRLVCRAWVIWKITF